MSDGQPETEPEGKPRIQPKTGPIKSVAVFCASNDGLPEAWQAAARDAGDRLARAGLRVVYGGSQVGLMGEMARAAMAAGGDVVGVLPGQLVRNEVAERTISELILVETLEARKTMMAEFADCFLVLPGGLGTLDEVVTELLRFDLGQHGKTAYLLNVDGFWDTLLAVFEHFDSSGVLRPGALDGLRIAPSMDAFLAAINAG